jgi:imidazolonepropionase-like amidohydrolase
MRPRFALLAILALSLTALPTTLQAQTSTLSPDVLKYVKVNAPAVLLTHVRIIDGTGAAPLEDQSLLIENGKITSISAQTTAAPSVAVIDLHGHTVIPGLVGMHDHLYYIARADEAGDDGVAV